MIEKLPHYLKGYVKIRLESPMPERFLSLCVHNGIPVWNLRNHQLYYEMELSVPDFFRLNAFRRKTASKIVVLEKHGLPFFLQRSRKRKAFFLGAGVCALLLYICSLFVWDIRVEGNHYNSSDTIRELLETMGVSDGILKTKLDCQEIAAAVRKEFPNVVWVSARLEGTCLTVEIKENQESYREEEDGAGMTGQGETESISRESGKDDEGSQEKQTDASGQDGGASQEDAWDLTASRDGTVVRIVTRSGMPLVKEGQEVKSGEILVSGALEILNNDQQIQRYQYVGADADVYLETEYLYYDEFPLKHTVREYTGKEENHWFVRLLGWELSLAGKEKEQQDTVRWERPVYLTDSFCLPVSYGKITQREYETVTRQYTEEEARLIAGENLTGFLENLVEEGAQVTGRNVTVEVTASRCVSRGRVTVIQECTRRSPVEEKQVPETP